MTSFYIGVCIYIAALFIYSIYSIITYIKQQETDLPAGKWAVLYIGEELSIQMNVKSIKRNGNKIRLWLREDRLADFTGISGVNGTTILTDISINCKNRTSETHRQMSFDSWMNLTENKELAGHLNYNEDKLSLISTFIICEINLQQEDVKLSKMKKIT